VRHLSGKVAVITGGGSGIGLGTARALAAAGMSIVIADIDDDAAAAAATELVDRGQRALSVVTDVADPASVEALANVAYAEFGAVHVLHNNAGTGSFLSIEETTADDWEWVLSVNLHGVINGIRAFLPRMKQEPGEKHIVNTASMAGLMTSSWLGAYCVAKSGVVALSETLRLEVADYGIGVSVVTPSAVRTNIAHNSQLRRPGGPVTTTPAGAGPGPQVRVLEPDDVGRVIRAGIEANEPYIITHPESRESLAARFESILAAFDRAAARERSGPLA
jgi:NAD(P)-dependent dehydrogenase (short-subunit alcohol dehydrogenase family)